MEKENFVRAFQFLEEGLIIKSLSTGREIKKVTTDYYWKKQIENANYGEWHMFGENEPIFTPSEIKSKWHVC